MSSPGFFYSAEEQAQNQALARRQAYARALMEQGASDPGNAQYGGLRSAGNAILGAYLAKKGDQQAQEFAQKTQGRYASDLASLLKGTGGAPAPSPQISTAAGTAPQMDQLDPEGNPMAQGQGPGYQARPQQAAPQQQAPQSFIDRLIATGNPALMAQFAPKVAEQQMSMEGKHITPMSPQEVQALGLRGVWGKDAAGNPVPIQQSDVKSKEAEEQGVRMHQAEQLLTPEALAQKIQLAKEGRSNPANVQSVQPLADGTLLIIRRDGTPAHVTMDGKPVEGARYSPQANYNVAAAKAGGTAAGGVAEALPGAEATFDTMKASIAEMKTPEMRKQAGWNTGLVGLTGVGRIPGVGSDFANKRDQFADQTFLQGFNALKGAGAISNAEGQAATNAYTRIKKAQTLNEFYAALDDAEAVITRTQNGIRERAKRGAVIPSMGGGQPQPQGGQQAAPRVRKYNPATGQIE